MAIIVQSICAMADRVVEKSYYGTEARNSKKIPYCKTIALKEGAL